MKIPPPARIVVVHEDAIVADMRLVKAVTVLGRHRECDVVIADGAVSGRHLLLRRVRHQVQLEDLASTNGTRVNGAPAVHQMLRHLDVLHVGHHRLHFFDGRDEEAAGEPDRAAGEAVATARDYAATRTLTMVPDLGACLTPADDGGGTGRQRTPAAMLALRVVQGESAGEIIALEQAHTMIGDPRLGTAIVMRRGRGHFLARLGGAHLPRLNSREVSGGTAAIAPGDLIEVRGARFEVVRLQ